MAPARRVIGGERPAGEAPPAGEGRRAKPRVWDRWSLTGTAASVRARGVHRLQKRTRSSSGPSWARVTGRKRRRVREKVPTI